MAALKALRGFSPALCFINALFGVIVLLFGFSYAEMSLAECQNANINITKTLVAIAHVDEPFVMKKNQTDRRPQQLWKKQDMTGFSIDVLNTIEERYKVSYDILMLNQLELERWDDKRDLIENKMFSRSLDMSANVLTRKNNRRQNLPGLFNGTIKALLKRMPNVEQVTNVSQLIQNAYNKNGNMQWSFGAVENSEAWNFLKNSKSHELKTLYRKLWDNRRAHNLPHNRTDGLNKVRKGTARKPYVLFEESFATDYYMSLSDELYSIELDPTAEDIEYVFGTGFDMKEEIKNNLTCIIKMLSADGTLADIKSKWWNSSSIASGNCFIISLTVAISLIISRFR